MRFLDNIGLRTFTLLQAFTRHRPRWMVNFAIEETNLSEGMRAGFACSMMLLLGALFNQPEFSWAAIGALWTCMADAAGNTRLRLLSMLSFTFLSAILGVLTAYTSSIGIIVSAITIFAIASLAGFVRIFNFAVYQVGILVAVACVVMVDNPLHGWHDTVQFVGIYLVGCFFATLLSVTIWRIHRFGPSRYALRMAFIRLSELAEDTARLIRARTQGGNEWAIHALTLRAQTRSAIESVYHAFNNLPRLSKDGSRKIYQGLLLALADAEKSFASLVAIAEVDEIPGLFARQPQRAARCLNAISIIFNKLGQQLGESKSAVYPFPLCNRLLYFSQCLEAAFDGMLALPFQSTQSSHSSLVEQTATPDFKKNKTREIIQASLAKISSQLSIYSPSLQFALRLGVATTIAFLIVRLLHLHNGYWASMAVLFILQPSIATTWPLSIERAIGTILGAIIAIVVGSIIHTPLATCLAVFLFICLTMTFRRVSYSLFIMFLTPSFVLVVNYALPGNEWVLAMERLGNNILGSVIAITATYLLWPNREVSNLQTSLLAALEASLNYLIIALQHSITPNIDQCESARRQAGLASNRVEHIYRLVNLEKFRHNSVLEKKADVFPLLRRIVVTGVKIQFQVKESTNRNVIVALIDWTECAKKILKKCLQGERSSLIPFFQIKELGQVEKAAVQQINRLSSLICYNDTPPSISHQ